MDPKKKINFWSVTIIIVGILVIIFVLIRPKPEDQGVKIIKDVLHTIEQ